MTEEEVLQEKIRRLDRSNEDLHNFAYMAAHELRRYDLKADTWKMLKPPGIRSLGSFNFEQVYSDEMRAFVDALRGRKAYPKTWAEDRHLSDVLVAAELSWKERRWINVSDVEKTYDGRSWIPGYSAAGR